MSSRSKIKKAIDDAKKEIDYENKRDVAVQIALAAVTIELHDRFKVGPGRAEPILDEILGLILDISKSIESDSKDDPKLEWTHQKLYAQLEQIFGDTWNSAKGAFDRLLPDGCYEERTKHE